MSDEKRILVTFGRSDPLHLTEATHEVLGETNVDYLWGPDFGRRRPDWAWILTNRGESLYDVLTLDYDVVYCGHGATLLEATAAGCEVMVLWNVASNPYGKLTVLFIPAWTDTHLDHSGKIVEWWKPGVMESMSRELVDRRRGGSTRRLEGSTTSREGENRLPPDPTPSGASWVHQAHRV